jgi:hypothetical protein
MQGAYLARSFDQSESTGIEKGPHKLLYKQDGGKRQLFDKFLQSATDPPHEMTRLLKTSGFLGLATMMIVGLYQAYLLSPPNPQAVPGWVVGGHAHLGVLSILALVMGFAVVAYGLGGRMRQAVSGLFIVGQWGVPLTVWGAEITGIGIIHITTFVWGAALVLSMLLMAYTAATTDAVIGAGGRLSPQPTD